MGSPGAITLDRSPQAELCCAGPPAAWWTGVFPLPLLELSMRGNVALPTPGPALSLSAPLETAHNCGGMGGEDDGSFRKSKTDLSEQGNLL